MWGLRRVLCLETAQRVQRVLRECSENNSKSLRESNRVQETLRELKRGKESKREQERKGLRGSLRRSALGFF